METLQRCNVETAGVSTYPTRGSPDTAPQECPFKRQNPYICREQQFTLTKQEQTLH